MWLAISWFALTAQAAGAKDELCPGLNFDQRPTLDVPDFQEQVSTRGNLDDVLADKLNVALLTSGCFAVRPLGKKDLPFEPRYRVQGTVTEYFDQGKEAPLMINGKPMKIWRARLELLVQITDIESGDILATETFRIRTKSTKTRSGSVSEAMVKAHDEAIDEITEFLAPYRTRMELPAPVVASP